MAPTRRLLESRLLSAGGRPPSVNTAGASGASQGSRSVVGTGHLRRTPGLPFRAKSWAAPSVEWIEDWQLLARFDGGHGRWCALCHGERLPRPCASSFADEGRDWRRPPGPASAVRTTNPTSRPSGRAAGRSRAVPIADSGALRVGLARPAGATVGEGDFPRVGDDHRLAAPQRRHGPASRAVGSGSVTARA